MKSGSLVYLNLILLAAASLLYASYGNDDSLDDGRMHLVYITTLPEGAPDLTDVQSATDAIESDWDCHVSILRSTEDATALARALKRAIAMNPKGISMPGNSDESLLLPFVTEARRQGIAVTFHSVPMKEAQKRYGKDGAGFAGSQGESSGYNLAQSAAERIHLAPDASVLLVGSTPEPMPGSRLKGSMEFFKTRNNKTEYLQVAPPADGPTVPVPDANLARRVDNSGLPRLIVWEAGPVDPLTTMLADNRIDSSDVSVVTLVPIEEPLPMLQTRYVTLQAQDRPFFACYYSLVQLQLTCRYKLPGIEIPIGGV